MRLLAKFLMVFLLFTVSVSTNAADMTGLDKALNTPGTLRSVFFIEAMSCRGCTTILDKRVGTMPGVFWARFNFPLRLLTVYHDPQVVPKDKIAAMVDDSKELKAVFLSEVAAADLKPATRVSLAEWKDGKVPLSDVVSILKPFEGFLHQLLGETSEISQVRYEILGENVRNRIFLALAKKAGYVAKANGEDLPSVITKDFYWPENLRAPNTDEKIIGAFIVEKVVKSNPEKSKEFFDAWLLALWREIDFNFYGEFAEGRLQ